VTTINLCVYEYCMPAGTVHTWLYCCPVEKGRESSSTQSSYGQGETTCLPAVIDRV